MLKSCVLAAAFACALAVPAASAAQAPAPTLTVTPAEGTYDAPFEVRVSGLAPGARVTVAVKLADNDGLPWTASATYAADGKGVVDATTAPSLGGSYQGVSAHGLICSALPVPAESLPAYIADFARKPGQSSLIGLVLERTAITVTASVDGREVASQTVGRTETLGGRPEPVSGPNGLNGLYFPAAQGVAQGAPVVVIGGSGGGVFDDTAALLASHGHPVLALALFRYEGVSPALKNYPLERVRDAALWLARKAGGRRVAVFGVSRGSEAAQLAAVNFPEAFSGVIALVPSHLAGGALGPETTVADAAWSVGGRPIPPFPFQFDPARAAEQGKSPPGYSESADFLGIWNDPAIEARFGIPYERLQAPILVLGADADDIWPSGVSAERIRRRLAAAGKARLAEVYVYPGAGHMMVYVGRTNAMSSFAYNPGLPGYMAFGGLQNENCEASFDHFARMTAFLRRLPR